MNPIRTILWAMAIACAGATGAEATPPPPATYPAGPQADLAENRSQTYLLPKPALRQQIERTQAFLDTDANGLDGKVSRSKQAGHLDRRGRSNIRSALEQARGALSRMAEDLEANKKINGWNARMVSYELGMAADTLAQQANALDATSKAELENRDQVQDGLLSEAAQAGLLAKTLRAGGTLVRATAQAIVDHLE